MVWPFQGNKSVARENGVKRIVAFAWTLPALALLTVGGCVPQEEYRKVVRRNDIQQERLQKMEAEREAARRSAEQMQQEYEMYLQKQGLTQQEIDALQAALQAKQAIIDELAGHVGSNPLPIELSSALAEWARQAGEDIVTYDEKTGSVRFKSDLLFAKGSDQVDPRAKEQLVKLSQILSGPAAHDFDVLVVGHTDDIPIQKPQTRQQHPTNLHLSAHRAIAVEQTLTEARLDPNRLVVVGCGEYRPLAPNQPGHKGNPANRRVDIFIVPTGQFAPAAPQTAAAAHGEM